MNLQKLELNKSFDFIDEIFHHLLDYADGEVIITDENLNILLKNSKFNFKNNKFSLENLFPDHSIQKII